MTAIGAVPMPTDFRYRDVFAAGRPEHDRYDPFSIRHPKMNVGHRAKIFSPFDALKGFGEAVASKRVPYRERRILSEEDRRELDRRLHILKQLTYNGRMARHNRVRITVEHYVPCADENSDAFCLGGQYTKTAGICRNVDETAGSLLVNCTRIRFDDIIGIENDDGVFQREWIPDPE